MDYQKAHSISRLEKYFFLHYHVNSVEVKQPHRTDPARPDINHHLFVLLPSCNLCEFIVFSKNLYSTPRGAEVNTDKSRGEQWDY